MATKGAAKSAQTVSRIRRKRGRLSSAEEAALNLNDSLTTSRVNVREARSALSRMASLAMDLVPDDSSQRAIVQRLIDQLLVEGGVLTTLPRR